MKIFRALEKRAQDKQVKRTEQLAAASQMSKEEFKDMILAQKEIIKQQKARLDYIQEDESIDNYSLMVVNANDEYESEVAHLARLEVKFEDMEEIWRMARASKSVSDNLAIRLQDEVDSKCAACEEARTKLSQLRVTLAGKGGRRTMRHKKRRNRQTRSRR